MFLVIAFNAVICFNFTVDVLLHLTEKVSSISNFILSERPLTQEGAF